MSQAVCRFPEGFLWGAATAAHQVEGDNRNNQWWKWEEQGRTNGRSGLACDWWGGRWREDFDRAAQGSQNAHRLSVEWSRIQPSPDTWDEAALECYRDMLRGLCQRGMLPMVTLHHFTDPLWLYEQDGWEIETVVPRFERFVRKTVEALKDYCALWCTVNEPNAYALNGCVRGVFPAPHRGLKAAMATTANLLRGHAVAYRAIHEMQPEAKVGYALHYRPMVARNARSPLDTLLRKMQYNELNLTFPNAISTGVMRSILGRVNIPEAKDTQDYFGINYYSVDSVRFDLAAYKTFFGERGFPEDSDFSETKFIANIPEGLFDTLQWAARAFPNLPISITENGVEDGSDQMRPRYIAQHIFQVWRGIQRKWPVQGYFYWTLVDNFEWERGWSQKFGLWGLDVETQARIKRASVDLYARICKENALSPEMVQAYCPEVLDKLFPV